jgi:dTDP-4-dehydrorhamnose reductase
MLGQDLTALLRARHQALALCRFDADIAHNQQIGRAIEQARPEVVIHTAAFTAVDECEIQPDLAFRVNADGSRNVALACRKLGISMLYVSTDYVFDGEKNEPYVESDLPNPISVYGRSKLEGERYVSQLLKRYWIVRTSWLFGPRGKNFTQEILRRARQGAVLRVVDDQVGSPTYTEDLAAKLEQIIERGKSGIYHVSNQGACSRFEFAQEILRQVGVDPSQVVPIPSSMSNRLARRPRDSRLANARLMAEGLGPLPLWQDALRRCLCLGRVREKESVPGPCAGGQHEWSR